MNNTRRHLAWITLGTILAFIPLALAGCGPKIYEGPEDGGPTAPNMYVVLQCKDQTLSRRCVEPVKDQRGTRVHQWIFFDSKGDKTRQHRVDECPEHVDFSQTEECIVVQRDDNGEITGNIVMYHRPY